MSLNSSGKVSIRKVRAEKIYEGNTAHIVV